MLFKEFKSSSVWNQSDLIVQSVKRFFISYLLNSNFIASDCFLSICLFSSKAMKLMQELHNQKDDLREEIKDNQKKVRLLRELSCIFHVYIN